MRVQLFFNYVQIGPPVASQWIIKKKLDTQTLFPGLSISLAVPISVHEEEHGDYTDLNRYADNYTLTFKATDNVLDVEIVYPLSRVVF